MRYSLVTVAWLGLVGALVLGACNRSLPLGAECDASSNCGADRACTDGHCRLVVVAQQPADRPRPAPDSRPAGGPPTTPRILQPGDGALLGKPPKFVWAPGANNAALYFNASTDPTMASIDVANYADDGHHEFAMPAEQYQALAGTTLYFRVVADGNGARVTTPIYAVKLAPLARK